MIDHRVTPFFDIDDDDDYRTRFKLSVGGAWCSVSAKRIAGEPCLSLAVFASGCRTFNVQRYGRLGTQTRGVTECPTPAELERLLDSVDTAMPAHLDAAHVDRLIATWCRFTADVVGV